MSLINCETKLDLTWSKYCVISQVPRTFRSVDPNADTAVYEVVTETTGAAFQINNAKLYVPVVTLAINDNIKFLENIKQGFKAQFLRTNIDLKWQHNQKTVLLWFIQNLRTLTDCLNFHSKMVTNDYFDKYCMPLVEIKDFNALIDNKTFFDQPVKNKKHKKNLLKC